MEGEILRLFFSKKLGREQTTNKNICFHSISPQPPPHIYKIFGFFFIFPALLPVFMVKSEAEIKAYRDMQKNRLSDLVCKEHIEDTRTVIRILTWVLEDD